VYRADQRAKWLMQHDEGLAQAIEAAFGGEAYLPNGGLNRAYLARTVFAEEDRLKQLNGLVHPRVAEDFAQWLEMPAQRRSVYAIKEAALLFETGSYRALESTIAVLAPDAVKIRRVLLRDLHRDRQQVQQIIRTQMRDRERIALADHIIRNDGTTPLIPQVLQLHEMLCKWTLPK
jgi:dephospho-CoA kinase